MPDHEETLDAARTEQVRRLLAEARHTEPMPEPVAARLDAVLADLREGRDPGATVAEPPAATPGSDTTPNTATVASLAARRRRRAAALLVAAAVVVVGGFAVPRLATSGQGNQADSAAESSGAGATADRNGAEQAAPDDSARAGASPGSSAGSASSGASAQQGSTTPPAAQQFQSRISVVVRPSHFADDVAAARRLLPTSGRVTSADSMKVQDCAPVAGSGDVVAVRYAGAVGALVFRPPTGDTQLADLYLCGTSVPVRSITLPRH